DNARSYQCDGCCGWESTFVLVAARRRQATPQSLQKSVDRHHQQFIGAEKQKARSNERAS
ncbi:hypothetical protein, partial [Pseudomonas kurunegalensis]|uniref:hypothetical protein n=1 Tax=Pseudomonas kurunegalensis TaxID=485880 RepID=UPI0023643CA7